MAVKFSKTPKHSSDNATKGGTKNLKSRSIASSKSPKAKRGVAKGKTQIKKA